MQIADYIGRTEFDMIHFSLSLIKEIDYKIKQKVFFYQNQVSTFINDQVERFVHTLHVKGSLQYVYKAEIHKMITPKLKMLFEKHCLFHCV
ncbi:hypothetical protein [Metabacillus halosaccharovorans]|uniref:hypothetical protein n=1 Tax=Metabacillus halosaccharovorans TaxID=930124 RepID=UPI001C2009D2|nr:hypothetical protein [Metabacillus halosaccharovorans]MBU7593159.1 hypothetical protein [Metabacillus halosaccharovorans]